MEAVKIDSLSFKRKQLHIFQSLTLSISKGQFIGLLGPNGTGKSTLLKCIAGIISEHEGSITLLGKQKNTMKPIEMAKMVSYMPQTTFLETNFTVEQVVKMGRYPHKKRFSSWDSADSEAVQWALELTKIGHLKDRLVPSLSGGERQLVYLAKTIAQDTPILLLDEPTSDLDVYHQVIVTIILHQLIREGKTVIAAIHDINFATRICDQCMFMKDGQIVDFGRNEQIMCDRNFYETFHVKSHIYKEPFTGKKQMIPYDVHE